LCERHGQGLRRTLERMLHEALIGYMHRFVLPDWNSY
jgi:hypothetical protein